MVLYFSGTGNSRFIARKIAERLDETLVNLNGRIKRCDFSPISEKERLIFVSPTYAWRIPRVMEDWIRRVPFTGGKDCWFVMDCGSEIGNADQYLRRLCAQKGLRYHGVAQVVMPENYVAMFPVPDQDEARQIIEKAQPAIERTIQFLSDGRDFPRPRRNGYDRLMSCIANPLFYRFAVKARAFRVDGRCTGCGQCARLCPLNNIQLSNGRPLWGSHCTHCMACICLCPAQAVEYGQKSVGKPRYHCD